MPPQLVAQDFLDAVDRVMDEGYLAPLKAYGDGYELLQGYAKIGERCSLAVRRFELDGLLASSAGPARATVAATFYRDDATAGAGTVLTGTLVRCSIGGQVFVTTADAVFGGGTLEVTVDAEAVAPGYEWNIRGPFVDRDGTKWPGELDTIDLPLQNPPFFDASIQVRNDADADGVGRPGTIDMIGAERGLPRQPTETDANYRARIRSLPDTVSPNAILRQLSTYFRSAGINWRAVETWQHEYQECFDAPNEPATPYQNYNSNLFCFDDPRAAAPMQNRWLGEQDYLGAFIVEIERPPTVSDYGFAYDDDATTEDDLRSPLGIRAAPAYDVVGTLSPPSLAPCYDGLDFGAQAIIVEAFNLIDEIKAGGVYAVIVIQELS
jgi:hypothetical protein